MAEQGDFLCKIEGLKEAIDAIAVLPAKRQSTVLYNIHRRAARFAVLKLKQNAPVSKTDKRKYENKLKNGIIMQKSPTNKTGIWVGFKRKNFYVKTLEFGVSAPRIVKGRHHKYKGASRGVLSPHPFVERSHNEAMPQIQKVLGEDYVKLINKAITSALKRSNKKLQK